MKGWIHSDSEVWLYGMLREDGQIEDGDYGSIVYIKEKQHYSCTSTRTKKSEYAKSLEKAKKLVEAMLS